MTIDPDHAIPAHRRDDDRTTEELGDAIAEIAADPASGRLIATAESLTAGNLAAHLGRAPSSGEWFAGGVVAYRREVKHRLLRVPDGPVVSERSARAMAATTAELFGADLAIAITGEAGPEPQEDVEPGTVWFGLFDRERIETFNARFEGDPADVLGATIRTALQALLAHLPAPG